MAFRSAHGFVAVVLRLLDGLLARLFLSLQSTFAQMRTALKIIFDPEIFRKQKLRRLSRMEGSRPPKFGGPPNGVY